MEDMERLLSQAWPRKTAIVSVYHRPHEDRKTPITSTRGEEKINGEDLPSRSVCSASAGAPDLKRRSC